MLNLLFNQLDRTTVYKLTQLLRLSTKLHTNGKLFTEAIHLIFRPIIIWKALNLLTLVPLIILWLYSPLMLHLDMLVVQDLKTKMIMNLTNCFGLCLEKAHFKDVWSVVKSSNLSDLEMNFLARWITICQTSISYGSKIWVNMILHPIFQWQKPILTSNIHFLNNHKILLQFLLEVTNTIESLLIQLIDFKDKLKVKWKLKFILLLLKILKNKNSLTPIPEHQLLKSIMRILSKLKPPSKNWTETSEKFLNSNQENMLIQSITKEEKKEWNKDQLRDGMEPIQFTLDN